MMKEENILLSLDNVSKLYKMGETVVTALDGVSFNVERGEFLSIMGPSGLLMKAHQLKQLY